MAHTRSCSSRGGWAKGERYRWEIIRNKVFLLLREITSLIFSPFKSSSAFSSPFLHGIREAAFWWKEDTHRDAECVLTLTWGPFSCGSSNNHNHNTCLNLALFFSVESEITCWCLWRGGGLLEQRRGWGQQSVLLWRNSQSSQGCEWLWWTSQPGTIQQAGC